MSLSLKVFHIVGHNENFENHWSSSIFCSFSLHSHYIGYD